MAILTNPGTLVRRAVAAASLFALLVVSACEGGRRYEGTGRVEEVLRGDAQIVIDHEEIPGLMDAMTMSFGVADPELLEGITAGQRVDFTLLVSQSGMRLVELRASGAGEAGADGASRAPVPRFAAALARNETAPPFQLMDQRGEPLRLADLAGRTLLIDFVFTQCAGPCPILTAKHVAVQRALQPEVAARTWFVSISLDPHNDTPEALERYAKERGADLANWSFLTGEQQAVSEVVARYGVGTTRAADGTLEHVVATFLVDGEARIARRYLGLDHASTDIAADVTALVSATAPADAATARRWN